VPHILYTLEKNPPRPRPGEPRDFFTFAMVIRKLYEQLARVVNGQISFGPGTKYDNIAGVWATVVDTGLANTDFTIIHNLGYVPSGWIPMNQTLAGVLYKGSVAWTTTMITLRCSVAHDNVTIFIV
jgi:hypothetical protein